MSLKKFKDFFKSKYFIIGLITLLALFIRLLNIDKQCGLWYDEMLTYVFSSKSFPLGILKTLLRYDFHMPLYYMSVHVWMKIFGTADTTLRLYSVMWGVLTIPAFFYLGKIYKSDKLGYFFAIIGCLSPVLIYFSQEFRFYSMLVFFATLSLIYFLKLLEDSSKKNLFLFGFANLIILYIYTMGIIFVSIEFLLLFVHFYLYKKDAIKILVKYSVVFFVCAIPYLLLLFSYLVASSESILDPFPFGKSNIPSIIFILNDWFSPFLACQYGGSKATYGHFIHNPANLIILSFFSIPTVCFLAGFMSALKKINKTMLYLLAILFVFLFVEIFLTLTGSFLLVTKYTLIVFPILLLISADGLLSIKSVRIRKTLISLIFIIFIYNIINYTKMFTFTERPSGYKTLTNELNKLELTQKDYVIYPCGASLVKKYLRNTNYIEFDVASATYLDKTKQEAYKIFDKNFILTTTKRNSADKLIPFFKNPKPPKTLEKYINSQINRIPNNRHLIFIEDFEGKKLSSKQFSQLIKFVPNDLEIRDGYHKLIFSLFFNKIYSDLNIILKNNSSLKLIKTTLVKGPGKKGKKWKIYVYQKQV